MGSKMEISVVVPLYNEEPNLKALFEELDDAMRDYGKPYDIIFVNDGSTDDGEKVLISIANQYDYVKVISLRKNAGKARALEQGFKLATGNKVVILDGDLQYDPKDIQVLADKIDAGCDVVSGKRVNRADSGNVVLTSRIFRMIVKKLSGLNFEDYFSGIKCFRSSVISYLGSYGDLNRIFTVYAYRAGFKVSEVPVTHRPRGYGRSKYNFFSRLQLAFFDALVLFYIVTISKEKLYRIGLVGFSILSCGSIMIVISLLQTPGYMAKEFFGSGLTRTGVLFIYLGWQLRVIEVVGREFVGRHEREHDLRARNVKEIYHSTGEKLNL